jgi:hypothetical protein
MHSSSFYMVLGNSSNMNWASELINWNIFETRKIKQWETTTSVFFYRRIVFNSPIHNFHGQKILPKIYEFCCSSCSLAYNWCLVYRFFADLFSSTCLHHFWKIATLFHLFSWSTVNTTNFSDDFHRNNDLCISYPNATGDFRVLMLRQKWLNERGRYWLEVCWFLFIGSNTVIYFSVFVSQLIAVRRYGFC